MTGVQINYHTVTKTNYTLKKTILHNLHPFHSTVRVSKVILCATLAIIMPFPTNWSTTESTRLHTTADGDTKTALRTTAMTDYRLRQSDATSVAQHCN